MRKPRASWVQKPAATQTDLRQIQICEPIISADSEVDSLMTDSHNPVLTLSLNPDTHMYWQNWKKGVPRLRYIPSGDNSLTISVQASTGTGTTKQLLALVDTGAAMPLVVKSGLFPLTEIQKSVWPVKFVTASGTVMPGGTTGVKVEISFAVAVPQEHGVPGGDKFDKQVVVCEPIWAYEADLHKTDLILGYPFLKGFGLAVDPVAEALIFSPVSDKICKKSPQCSNKSSPSDVHNIASCESCLMSSQVVQKSMSSPVTDFQQHLQAFQKSEYLMKPFPCRTLLFVLDFSTLLAEELPAEFLFYGR